LKFGIQSAPQSLFVDAILEQLAVFKEPHGNLVSVELECRRILFDVDRFNLDGVRRAYAADQIQRLMTEVTIRLRIDS
jgi:hypothetical protein